MRNFKASSGLNNKSQIKAKFENYILTHELDSY